MKILAPFLSVVLEPSDTTVNGVSPLDQALSEGYSQIFIQTAEGYFKYHSLQPGINGKRRFVCLPVKEIPGIAFPKVVPSVEFLPDGKIPIELLDEIKEFFSQVITKKGRNLEAMIWILWNPELGYHLHVPNQTVGGASATYDWASLPKDSSIVVDIHSHADFGAFFSGTDDRDDSNCIRFSGVIGYNNRPVREMKFRFTYYGTRMDVQLDELFERKVTDVDIPEEWFDKVTTHTYQTKGAGHPYHPGMNGWQGFHRPQGNPVGNPVGTHGYTGQTGYTGMSGPIHGVQVAALTHTPTDDAAPGGAESKKLTKKEKRELALSTRSDRLRNNRVRREHIKILSHLGQPIETSELSGGTTSAESQEGGLSDEEYAATLEYERQGGVPSGSRFLDGPNGLVAIGNRSLTGFRSETDDYIDMFYEEQRKAMAKSELITTDSELDDALSAQADKFFSENAQREEGKLDSIAINHGVEIMQAFTVFEDSLPVLSQAPDIFKQSLEGMFSLLSDDMKLSAFRNMAEQLSDRDKDRLASQGF